MVVSGSRGRFAALIAFLALPAVHAGAAGTVTGNLITFSNDGDWCWYQDERAVYDPTNGVLLLSTVGSSGVNGTGAATSTNPFPTSPGTVFTTAFNTASMTHSIVPMSLNLNEDDHAAGAFLILPDGRYLTMYSKHGNTGAGDPYSRYRISVNPHDATSWTAEQTFNWSTTPGWSLSPNANNNVSYHNLFYLSAENQVYDISRGTHQAMNLLAFDMGSNTFSWSGQFEQSPVAGYGQGYFKFASNGVDRIYFIGTETHPRNNANSVFSGYISGGKTYRMDGALMDANVHDSLNTSPAGTVPNITAFTLVQADAGSSYASQSGANVIASETHLWTTDLALAGDGKPVALFTSRGNNDNTTFADHRIAYGRWDGTRWSTIELAKMGARLYSSEEDYTGLGALAPGDSSRVYLSTPYIPWTSGPVATGAAGTQGTAANSTGKHEIFQGVTADGGSTWTWTQLTFNSTVDNLRPAVQAMDGGRYALVWMRGTYTTAQNIDTAMVGMIISNQESVSAVHYVDASPGNTSLVNALNGATALSTTGPSANITSTTAESATANRWNLRTGVGNGGSVFDSSGTSSLRGALRTTLFLPAGTYDLFGFFWADTNDWRLLAGLDPAQLALYRTNGAQQATGEQFDSADVMTSMAGVADATGNLSLYRVYLGRKTLTDTSGVSFYFDDSGGSAATTIAVTSRTWYDGVGYSLVTGTAAVPEPGTVVVLAAGGLWLLRRGRGRGTGGL